MKRREKEIIDGVAEILKGRLDPSKIILFGSRAKKKNDERADFDIAVDCEKPAVTLQREISDEIENISGLYKVDVVYMMSVDKEFKDIILKTGEVIYERRA